MDADPRNRRGYAGAIMIVPGLELTAESIRAGADYSASTEGVLHFAPLLTLAYFYAGPLLLPLAALGAWKTSMRISGIRSRWRSHGVAARRAA